MQGAFGPDVAVFRALGHTPEQREWLAQLPGRVAELERRWDVRTGLPFAGGTAAWVAPATARDGESLVLKISWPHREARHEHEALRLWDGEGAVRLREADGYALLLERCDPGLPLSRVDSPAEQALVAGGSLLKRLWRPAPSHSPFETVRDVCAEWATLLRERMATHRPPFDPALVARGADLLESLPASATRDVVVHGDFNPGNILSARRSPWLAIDAKPMTGDPGYDPEPLASQVDDPMESADPPATYRRRFRLLADVVGEPAERLLAWGLARRVESALWWVATRDDVASGAEDMAQAAAMAAALDA